MSCDQGIDAAGRGAVGGGINKQGRSTGWDNAGGASK